MKMCPPQVNQKQTKVAEETGFVFVNPGTWALQGKSAAKNRTQNCFNAQCKLSRRRLNRVPPLPSLHRDTPKLLWGLCVAYLNSLCKGILLESHD